MKKLISIILCLLLILSTASLAFAAESENECPYIYIHGFMANDLYSDKNDHDSDKVWPPSSDAILGVVEECLPDILSFLATKNYDKLKDSIMEPVKGLLSSANLDSDGNASDGSGVYFVYPSASSITKSSKLRFKYDWRLDPVELAGQLNDFINYVLESSGAKQVTLECHSFGGIVTEAYSKIYGSSKIKSVCYNTTAIFGETYTGEMLTGNIVLNAEAITVFFKNMLSTNEYNKLLNGLFDLLYSAGITGDICQLGNDLIENIGDDVIKEVILPMFAGWLSIWAMIPDSYVDDAIDYVFNGLYEGDIASHRGLYDKITNYNAEVRVDKADTLIAQNESVNLYVITRYNRTSAPLVPSWKVMSDGVVDSKASSFGSQFADFGDKLPEDIIIAHKDDNLVNPDGTVYVGSCLFPEQTWFIRDFEHSDGCDDEENMVQTLLYYDGQATVNTFEKYPRFLQWNNSDDTITPDTEGTPEVKQSLFDKIFNFILKIVAFRRSIFNFIFKK